ncbi:type VI secretion system Vgr family protein [Trinickia sp.]|uniref:type VI secretion system Vgr family protein n=1 Tax=Trinickia sp. TaxID=2571163 RepID=UPI003F7FEDA8
MSYVDQIRSVAEITSAFGKRPVRTNWGHDRQREFDYLLALLYADIHEGLMTGVIGRLVYVSAYRDLLPSRFLGLPVGIEMYAAATRRFRTINGIVAQVRIGASDGELTCYEFTIVDAIALLRGKFNSRIFKSQSLPDIVHTLFSGYSRTPAFSRAVDIDLSMLDSDRYPERAFVRQADESDGKFIERLARRDGIAYFARAGDRDGKTGKDSSTPMHTIAMFDDPMRLPHTPAGALRFRRSTGTDTTEGIVSIERMQTITPGKTSIRSPDYKTADVDGAGYKSQVDHGEFGNGLAALLADYRIDAPHAGDSESDLNRLAQARMLSHDHRAQRVDFTGNVIDIGIAEWFELQGYAPLALTPEEERRFVTIELHRRLWNNLPKMLDEQAQRVFAASRARFAGPIENAAFGTDYAPLSGERYEIAFSCVPRGVPLTPAYDPRIDLPPTPPILGRVVASEGMPLTTDEYGRAWVQLLGLNPRDHEDGAGTSGTPADSAPLLALNPRAGERYGFSFPLRPGMLVVLDSLGGDPNRLFIKGTLNDAAHMPTAFSRATQLPGNPYMLGFRSREINGGRGNQVVFSDWPGQINAQVASDEGYSQLNLGHIAHPSASGRGKSRGYGAELRTDAALVARAAQGLMLTTYARTAASGGLLDRNEMLELLDQFGELFAAMGDYAHQHGLEGPDKTGLDRLGQKLKQWRSEPGANDGDMMAFAARGGAGHFTPKTYGVFAGENVDHAAAKHIQMTAGARLHASARERMEFNAGAGLKATAAHGPMQLEAHDDSIRLAAQKAVEMESMTDVIRLSANKAIELQCGGAVIRIADGNIEIHAPGGVTYKGSSHSFHGPASSPTQLAPFKPSHQAQYVLRDQSDGTPLPRHPYSLKTPGGRTLRSVTSERGETTPVFTQDEQDVPLHAVKQKPVQTESWQFAGLDRTGIAKDYVDS